LNLNLTQNNKIAMQAINFCRFYNRFRLFCRETSERNKAGVTNQAD